MGAGAEPRGHAARRRGRLRPMSEINVTPFVDVMLVLLIIFMVAAPLLTVGVSVELPETDAPPLPAEQEAPLTVTVDAGGTVSIQDNAVSFEELPARLAAIREARGPDDRVYLRADERVDYGRVARLIAALNRAGFLRISFVHDQRVPEAEE